MPACGETGHSQIPPSHEEAHVWVRTQAWDVTKCGGIKQSCGFSFVAVGYCTSSSQMKRRLCKVPMKLPPHTFYSFLTHRSLQLLVCVFVPSTCCCSMTARRKERTATAWQERAAGKPAFSSAVPVFRSSHSRAVPVGGLEEGGRRLKIHNGQL